MLPRSRQWKPLKVTIHITARKTHTCHRSKTFQQIITKTPIWRCKTLSDPRRWTGSRRGRWSELCAMVGTSTVTFRRRRSQQGRWTPPIIWIARTAPLLAPSIRGGWWARWRRPFKRRLRRRRTRRRARPPTPRKATMGLSFPITGEFRGQRSQGRTGLRGPGIASWSVLAFTLRVEFVIFIIIFYFFN